MPNTVEGFVERYAPNLCSHGDHGFTVLLRGGKTLFHFSGARNSYSALPGRPSSANSTLAEMMACDDHISFEITGDPQKLGFFVTVVQGSLRNWTLENRLHGTVKDITPKPELLNETVQRLR